MAELSTESATVAHVFAAIEMLRMLPATQTNEVKTLTANYKAIHKALREAYSGK